jgi:adenosylhomocysteine nucleosidase
VIAITFALPVESAGLVRLLRERERGLCGEIKVLRGQIDNRRVEILHTGVGEKACRQRMEMFLQDRQFDLLISAGFAGALNDQLQVGDILLAQNFSTANIDQVRSLLSNHPVQSGDLVTTSRVIDSREERYQIAKSTGAAAADMETDFIARACAERALPMLSLRAISDTPARPLPVPPGILFDIDQQKTRLGKLSLYLLKHPRLLPNTISFAGQVRAARRALTDALDLLLRSNFWRPND